MKTTEYYIKQLADNSLEIDETKDETELKELISEREDLLITIGISVLVNGVPVTVEDLKEQVDGLNKAIASSNDLEEQKSLIKGRDALNIKIGYELAKSLFAPELIMEPKLSEEGNIPLDDARDLMTEVGDLWQELDKMEKARIKLLAENSIGAQVASIEC